MMRLIWREIVRLVEGIFCNDTANCDNKISFGTCVHEDILDIFGGGPQRNFP